MKEDRPIKLNDRIFMTDQADTKQKNIGSIRHLLTCTKMISSRLLATPTPGTSSAAVLKYLPFLNMPCFLTPPCLCTSCSLAWERCPCDGLLLTLQLSADAQPSPPLPLSVESFWIPLPSPSLLPNLRPKQSTCITWANFLTPLSLSFLKL